MIRKTLLLGLLVLALLIVGIPGLVGLYLSRHLDAYVEAINRPGVMRVIGTRYHRGWFQSEARLTIQLADRLCARPPCATLTLNSTIYHGLWAFTAPPSIDNRIDPAWVVVDSRLRLATLWPQLRFEPSLAPLHIVTRVALNGHVSSRAWLPAARFEVARDDWSGHVYMTGLHAALQTSLTDGALKLSLAWPLLRINGTGHGYLELQGLSAGVTTAGHGRIVQQHLRLKSLALDAAKGPPVRLEKLVWQAGPVPGAADGMATQFDLRVGRLLIDAHAYGQLTARGRIKGVDLSIWHKLRAQFIDTPGVGGPGTTAMRTLYNLYLPPVLDSGPVFDVEHFSLKTPQGRLSGRVLVEVPDDFHAPDSLAGLLKQLRVVLRMQVPAALLRRGIRYVAAARNLLDGSSTNAAIEKTVAALADRGLIKPLPDENAYRVRLTVEHGTLRLDGRRPRSGWAGLLSSSAQHPKTFRTPSARGKMFDSH